jgi:hypothetical protein
MEFAVINDERVLILKDLRQFHVFFYFAAVCLWLLDGLRIQTVRENNPLSPLMPCPPCLMIPET